MPILPLRIDDPAKMHTWLLAEIAYFWTGTS
jgi:hypothetical protein